MKGGEFYQVEKTKRWVILPDLYMNNTSKICHRSQFQVIFDGFHPDRGSK
jgi:hypothetical protein